MSHESSIFFDRRPKAYVVRALLDLRKARDSLRLAGADKAAEAVNRALKSAEGALRHAEHMERRAEEAHTADA